MRLLVTGAGGMLGQDVVAAADAVHHEVAAYDRDRLDVTDREKVLRVIGRERPDVVINCAAYTAVDAAESDEDGASAVNVWGAENVALAAAEASAKVIYPSTDYVFDGTKSEPYVETDTPAPLSVYGHTKLGGEIKTAAANARHIIVRTSWLFGIGGRNFVETMLELGAHGEVLVVHDQVGCPTHTGDLAPKLVTLAEGSLFGVHHVACTGYCSWWEFAKEIFDQAGMDVTVLAGTTEMLGRPAPRPAFAALGTLKPGGSDMPAWPEGLASYMAIRARLRETTNGGVS